MLEKVTADGVRKYPHSSALLKNCGTCMMGVQDESFPFCIGAITFSVDLTREQPRSHDCHI